MLSARVTVPLGRAVKRYILISICLIKCSIIECFTYIPGIEYCR